MNQPTETTKLEPLAATPKTQTEQGGCTNEEKQGAAPTSAADFETLIHGRYKEAFAAKVQKIIDARFKELKTIERKNEQLTEKINRLQQSNTAEDNAVSEDCSGELPAPKAEQNKNLKAEENESGDLKTKNTATDKTLKSSTANQENAQQNEQTDTVQNSAPTEHGATPNEKEKIQLTESELQLAADQPIFGALLNSGIEPHIAFAALFPERMLHRTLTEKEADAARELGKNLRLRAARPLESAMFENAATVSRTGVHSLTPAQRKRLASRSMMGEDIGF